MKKLIIVAAVMFATSAFAAEKPEPPKDTKALTMQLLQTQIALIQSYIDRGGCVDLVKQLQATQAELKKLQEEKK